MVAGNTENITLAIREGENEFDYHRRLVYGKMLDKTLADKDYSELAEHIYGKPYSSDVARRMVYGSCKTLQLIDHTKISKVDSSDIIVDIEKKTKELQIERQRLFDQRREYNKHIIAESRQSNLEDRLIEEASRLDDTIGKMDYSYKCVINDENEAILVLCDWHYGMVTNNIWNSYDSEICKQRVHKVFTEAAVRLKLHHCRRLHIVVLGDLFHGSIHVSARVASEELVCDQLMKVSEILSQSVDYISRLVESTSVYMTYGNHARTVQLKNDSIHRDNMERIIPWWMEQRLKDRNDIEIVNNFENELMYIDSCGYGICATHGDIDSVKTSPRILTTIFHKKYGKEIDYVLLGDKHHRESFEELGVSSIICDALCGADDYANEKRLYSTPGQAMFIVTRGVGIDAEYHLRCE